MTLLATSLGRPVSRSISHRTASQCFRQHRVLLSSRLRPSFILPQSTATRVSAFSTMSPLKADTAAVSGSREFDPEIKDMASYIHSYKVDSDLAVSEHLQSMPSMSILTIPSMKPLATYSSIRLAAALKPSDLKNAPSSSAPLSPARSYRTVQGYLAHHTYLIPSTEHSTLVP